MVVVAMQPFVRLGRYVNYLDDDELGESAAATYGSKPAGPERHQPVKIEVRAPWLRLTTWWPRGSLSA